MSLTLSVQKEIEFDRLVHHVFQARERLAGSTRTREGVTADSVKFAVMAAGIARERTAPQVKLELMNVVHTQVSCSLSNFNASDMTDMFDQAEVSWSEQAEFAQVIANGLGRRRDQIIIDALIDASISNVVAATGVGGENRLNIERINEAHRLLDLVECPSDGRHFVCHATSLSQFLGTTEGASQDYNNLRLLQQGGLQDGAQAFGFIWHKLGNRTEGGLSVDGNDVRQNFVYHRDAVGVAKGNLAKRTDISWLPDYASWLVSGFERMGACVIDTTGVVEVLTDET